MTANRITAARAAVLGTVLLSLAASAALSGCGLKGPLYLPQQKKSKVPPTINNPAPDTPAEPAPAPTDSSPSAPTATTPPA